MLLLAAVVGLMQCSLMAAQATGSDCTQIVCQAGQTLRFVAIGDWGGSSSSHYTPQQKTVADYLGTFVSQNEVDFSMGLGDNFYPSGVTSVNDRRFQSTFENVYTGAMQNVPFYVIAGNHDHLGNVSAQIQYSSRSKRWKFPDYYYTTNYRLATGTSVTFVYIDTVVLCGNLGMENVPRLEQKDVAAANAHWNWLRSSLEANSRSDYLFVLGHYPVYSAGEHGTTQCLVNKLQPLLQQYQVTAYLSGHDHDLQHLEPTPPQPPHYVISGAASASLRMRRLGSSTLAVSKFYFPNNSVEISNGNNGRGKGGFVYGDLDATKGRMVFMDGLGQTLHSFEFHSRTVAVNQVAPSIPGRFGNFASTTAVGAASSTSCGDKMSMCAQLLDRCRQVGFQATMQEYCAKSCGFCM